MTGVSVAAIRTASSPQTNHEIEKSPGSVEIGKRVRLGGIEYPARSNPNAGKPRIMVRRMTKQKIGCIEIYE